MTDDDAVAAPIQTNRLTVHDAAHLLAVVGDGRVTAATVVLGTAEGWVRIDAADGGVVVEQIDAPEGADE